MGLPRERTVVRPISCNPIQSYATISTELPRVAIAPDSILRTSGSSNLLISNCHSGASSPYSFVETSELQVDPASNCQVSMPMTVSQTNPAAPLTHSYLPVSMNENDVADICEESQSNPNVFETWPAEEEEKYRSMVSLLVDGSSTSPDRYVFFNLLCIFRRFGWLDFLFLFFRLSEGTSGGMYFWGFLNVFPQIFTKSSYCI